LLRKRQRAASYELFFRQEKELAQKFDENDYINTFNCSLGNFRQDFEDENIFDKDILCDYFSFEKPVVNFI
jgi:hypothetical protein